ncbi:MAG: ATP-binding protein [Prevotella sp.]|nr:ATP-binding protein [Prevotella sp.]
MIVQRDNYLKHLVQRRHNGMIKIITGMRRCGKSFLLFNLFYKHLLESGVDEQHIIKVDLESLYNIELRNPLKLLQHVDKLRIDNHVYYLLFDEIQLLDDFEEVLNTYLKVPNVDVYVTGSNARFLSKDVITTFRGRGDEIRVHPFCFAEYMQTRNSSSREQALLDYLQFGGMPQLVNMPTEQQKKEYLSALFQNTYLIDIKERYHLKNDADLEELMDVMASCVGSLTNPLKLQNTFKSVKKSSITVNTIKKYLDYMQDAFLMERSIRYDIKGRKYIDTPAKYYFEDLGVRNARLNFRQTEETHLMENLIYNELRLRGYSVDVGQVTLNSKDEEGKSIRKHLEIDFVCNKGYERIYIQSAYALATEEKQEQELRPLRQIKDGFQKVVITGGLQPTYRNNDGILILNVFDFLLNNSPF